MTAVPPMLLWAGVWAATVAAAVFLRPLLPVDETRYLAVAWEMWRDGHFMVPHLNGETYSHKPPLLFWSMHAGWAAFGVTDWWPRLVAPLYALAALMLTWALARQLWPGDAMKAARAWTPAILAGFCYWTLFTTVTFFDMPLTVAALIGVLGVVRAWRQGRDADSWRAGRWGFALIGIGIGIGVLAKGPAILLHILPVAVAAPLWGPMLTGHPPKAGWKGWYLGVLAGLGIGVAIALAWAVPAALIGGEAYRDAIFWGQSAGRMVNSFAHARPVWWFAVVLPGLLLPWTLWPGLWRAFAVAGGAMIKDGGARLCLIWLGVAFVAFSAISGKQPHYLLPEFPAIALLAAFALTRPSDKAPHRFALLPVAILFIVLGACVLIAPWLPLKAKDMMAVSLIHSWWGALPLALGLVLAIRPPAAVPGRMAALTLASGVLVLTAHLALSPLLLARHDTTAAARYLAELEKQGYALAFFGKYHGEMNFNGRLQNTVTPISLLDPDIDVFLAAHPKAKIVDYRRAHQVTPPAEAEFPYRAGRILIWDRALIDSKPRALHEDDEKKSPPIP